MRVWFPNLPSNGVDELDRSQHAFGISRSADTGADDLYLRRYLDDPLIILAVGPPVSPDVVDETDDTTYLRRYLSDPVL